MDIEALEVAMTIKKEIDFYIKKTQPADKQMLNSLQADLGKISYDHFDVLFKDKDIINAVGSYTENDIKTLITSMEISNHALKTMKDKKIDSLALTLRQISEMLERNIANYGYRIFENYTRQKKLHFTENDLLNIKNRWNYQKSRDFFASPAQQAKEWAAVIGNDKSLNMSI